MKILLYTISDFKPYSVECINLLLSSIEGDMHYDFAVISNNKSKIDTNLDIILDTDLNSRYVGYLKYSPKIPTTYDYYIYLDSDILYFDKISNLLPISKNFTIVQENNQINKNDWYYFKYLKDPEEDLILQNSKAVNAGSFAYSKNNLEAIKEIYYLYKTYYQNNMFHDVQLEQSIYNYIVNKTNNFDLSNCKDITDTTLLFASNKQPRSDKKLYHFCGFTNEMESKYRSMKKLYELYIDQR